MSKIAKEVRCVWAARPGQRGVYECRACKGWTANLPLYRVSVCSERDRRKGARDRRDVHAQAHGSER